MISDLVPPARAVFLTGFMGTGKTTTGRRLAERLGLAFLDTDDIVEERTGRTISAIFAESGEAAFREHETEALAEAVRRGPAVVGTGGGIMTQECNVAVMREAGPIVRFEASPETVNARTEGRSERPLLLTADPLTTIRDLMAHREASYAQADYSVSTDSPERYRALTALVALLADDPRTTLLSRTALRVPVSAGDAHYSIHIGQGALDRLGSLCPPARPGARAVVITTDTLAPLYGDAVVGALQNGGWNADLVAVADGEGSKTLETASVLYDRLVELGVDAGGTLFALGGGVVGDLTGFVAATYRRGIRFAQVPTSLVAQVDASVGGKVAVDHPRGKNLIGAFHQPGAVVVDPVTLGTLPERELRGGLAEVIKHAAIADAQLFRYLEDRLGEFTGLWGPAVRYVLGRNCQIKASVVRQDPLDRGFRACLNYGHTIGHAVERAAERWGMRHGEAVSVGMVAEAELGVELGLTEPEVPERLRSLLAAAGLPTTVDDLDMAAAEAALLQDKKIASGSLRLPVVSALGSVRIVESVAPDALVRALRQLVGR